jgi:hypothetical protein
LSNIALSSSLFSGDMHKSMPGCQQNGVRGLKAEKQDNNALS